MGRRRAPRRGRVAAARAPRRSKSGARRGGGRKRAPVDRAERKLRNRFALLIGVLALVNAYVFLWRDEGSLAELGAPRAAWIGGGEAGPIGTFADPLADTCGKDPVRIFDGLERHVALEAALTSGRTLRLALLGVGVDASEIDAIEAAIRPSVDLGLLAGSGAPVRLTVDREGGVSALEIELAQGHLLQACRDDGALAVRILQHPLTPEVVIVDLELGEDADLFAAVAAVDERPELAVRIAELLVHDLDFTTEAHPKDRVQLMVEKRYLGRSFHRYGEVLAIRYRGAAGRVAYYRHRDPSGAVVYRDRQGEPMARALRRTPLRFHPLPPGTRGLMEPTIEVVEGRVGAVYRRAEGAPVVALADGRVRVAGAQGDAGVVVEIERDDGSRIRYSHLARRMGGVEEGAEVAQGQLIGLAGHSGKTASDRVRVELLGDDDGQLRALDPLQSLATGDARPARVGEALEGAALEAFQAETGPWRKALLGHR
ncbi:MAG: M23 family metallopeptidase [Myxococcales bacterium]|nr:M23 family metallopeptidase [Myxococcales bacterium]